MTQWTTGHCSLGSADASERSSRSLLLHSPVSDPGVFTGRSEMECKAQLALLTFHNLAGILKELGVVGLEVEELYGLDADLLSAIHPVKALVFLFKWIGQGDPAAMDGKLDSDTPPDFFFAHQVITNACASMALLNAVCNITDDPDVELGEELSNLKAFSEGLDPESKGWTISNAEKVRAGEFESHIDGTAGHADLPSTLQSTTRSLAPTLTISRRADHQLRTTTPTTSSVRVVFPTRSTCLADRFI